MPVAAPRALAFEVLRETFEREGHTEVAFRAGAERLGLDGRDRAQAQRLAYGSVQRRGTSDAAIERLSGRAMRLLDPPVAAALRLGLYELLFADATPDHAAVDQAVELVKITNAGHASGFVNAILRRAARERAELTAALLEDDSTPEAAAVAHSAPLWLALMWWEELGAEAARSLLAACNEPAEVAMRAADQEARADLMARLRGEGVDVSPAGGGWPLDVAEAMVFRGRTGDSVPRLVAEGMLTPQSRGSAAVVEVLAPRAGETVLDLCAGPGIKTGQIATRMEDREAFAKAPVGMPIDRYKRYMKLIEKRHAEDLEFAQKRALEQQRKQQTKEWKENRTAILRVPSVITSGRENNIVFNPEHSEFALVHAEASESVHWDARLFR